MPIFAWALLATLPTLWALLATLPTLWALLATLPTLWALFNITKLLANLLTKPSAFYYFANCIL